MFTIGHKVTGFDLDKMQKYVDSVIWPSTLERAEREYGKFHPVTERFFEQVRDGETGELTDTYRWWQVFEEETD